MMADICCWCNLTKAQSLHCCSRGTPSVNVRMLRRNFVWDLLPRAEPRTPPVLCSVGIHRTPFKRSLLFSSTSASFWSPFMQIFWRKDLRLLPRVPNFPVSLCLYWCFQHLRIRSAPACAGQLSSSKFSLQIVPALSVWQMLCFFCPGVFQPSTVMNLLPEHLDLHLTVELTST